MLWEDNEVVYFDLHALDDEGYPIVPTCTCCSFPYYPSNVRFGYRTNAALIIPWTIEESLPSIPRSDRHEPLLNTLIIDLIGRVHTDRNKLFHHLTADKFKYYCINRTWLHFYEWMFHCNDHTDFLYATVRGVPITICDLFSKDKATIPVPIPPRCIEYPYLLGPDCKPSFIVWLRNKMNSVLYN